MIVYHTSYTVVRFPDTRYSREALDFGKGFYLSDDWESSINFKHFTAYDEEWLDFVSANRKRLPVALFDAVEGGVANDKVFRTLDLYFSGDIDKQSALKKLRYEEPNHQICLLSQRVIDEKLKFIKSELI